MITEYIAEKLKTKSEGKVYSDTIRGDIYVNYDDNAYAVDVPEIVYRSSFDTGLYFIPQMICDEIDELKKCLNDK